MKPALEGRDDAEISAATAQRPEEDPRELSGRVAGALSILWRLSRRGTMTSLNHPRAYALLVLGISSMPAFAQLENFHPTP